MNKINGLIPKNIKKYIRYIIYKKHRYMYKTEREVKNKLPLAVQSGPFAGMKYIKEAIGSAWTPKIVGTYEKELHNVLMACDFKKYNCIIDIGAAEGYYAVGLARFSGLPVVAFESDEKGRLLLSRMAEINLVQNLIRIEGFCDAKALQELLSQHKRCLLVCDCEGGEYELLDPAKISDLSKCDIILEYHGRIEVPMGTYPNHPLAMAAFLTRRFEATHEVELIRYEARQLSDWPSLSVEIPLKYRQFAMEEQRSEGSGWLWMRAKVP